MARKKKPEEHENHERWLVSYADFITLLFAFFVVMYAVSSVNEGKYRVLSDALLAAFRSPTKTLAPIQVGSPAKSPQGQDMTFRQIPRVVGAPQLPLPSLVKDKPDTQGGVPDPLAEIADQVEDALARLIDEDLISVRREQDFVEIEIKSNVLFPAGGTRLPGEAQDVLERVAGILKNFPNYVRVEGFTDDTPINTVVYPSNWELSAARAATVVRLFEQNGVLPKRLSAVGFAEHQPIADNGTLEGRVKNRRVVVVVQNKTDQQQFREDLYLSSEMDSGGILQRQPVPVSPAPQGWEQPRDVTDLPVTDQGRFPVMQAPIELPPPVNVEIVPPVEQQAVENPGM
jgi:chemotaxis protein MotB